MNRSAWLREQGTSSATRLASRTGSMVGVMPGVLETRHLIDQDPRLGDPLQRHCLVGDALAERDA